MIFKELELINLPPGNELSIHSSEDVLVIKTCQRILLLGLGGSLDSFRKTHQEADYFENYDAYHFLLETICGLKSKILGEYEIVSQFKKAYQEYVLQPRRQGQLIKIIEKLFKDSKDVRTRHLLGIGQLSYSGISRKILKDYTKETDTEDRPVLIIGTGNLAEDLLKLMTKKKRVLVTGRNKIKLDEITYKYGVPTLNWDEKESFADYPLLINTVGTTEVLFDEVFFQRWFNQHDQYSLFIDLGSPSSISTSLNAGQRVLRLEDIFRETAKLSSEKLEKIQNAREHIRNIVAHKKHSAELRIKTVKEMINRESEQETLLNLF